MDLRAETREVLTTRRGRITAEMAGLAAYGDTGRVPGLRREEVAMLAVDDTSRGASWRR